MIMLTRMKKNPPAISTTYNCCPHHRLSGRPRATEQLTKITFAMNLTRTSTATLRWTLPTELAPNNSSAVPAAARVAAPPPLGLSQGARAGRTGGVPGGYVEDANRRAQRSERSDAGGALAYFTPRSSTSNINVAFAGITPGYPRSPYASFPGMISLRLPPASAHRRPR